MRCVYLTVPVGDGDDVRWGFEKACNGGLEVLQRPTLAGKQTRVLVNDIDAAYAVIQSLYADEDSVFRNRDWFWQTSHLLQGYRPIPRFTGVTA